MEGQNKAKIGQKWSKMVFFGPFRKSSKKNFNFALIRPFFGGRAQPLKMGVDFCPFWIETIWESVLRVPIRLLLSDAFFFGAPGGHFGDPHFWHKRIFRVFWCFWPFLVIFGVFWPFLLFLVFLVILAHFGCFWAIFELFLTIAQGCCFWCS